ncbi:phosphatase 2C-like domain-containing protein [Spinellus fusiger]|nr:phosphatase 2C-like domain-containing protein [Spinellus fusiger]
MGQTLSEPNTIKSSEEGGDQRIIYGMSCMQGWRPTMEDCHTLLPSYRDTQTSFFAVYDGHGGNAVANYSRHSLHTTLFHSQYFARHRYRDALKGAYLAVDDQMRQGKSPLHPINADMSGCTAVVALLTKENVLYVCNAGDSRAVISTTAGKAIPLSKDHKPHYRPEHQRITQAGAYVECGRVNGSLALSRALGDFHFKRNPHLPPEKQAVTAAPDITEHELTDKDEFVVLACDGIWDCMTNQQVVDFIRRGLKEEMPLKGVCEKLIDACLAKENTVTGIGCDNMTVIIIGFLRKRTHSGWHHWMATKPLFSSA